MVKRSLARDLKLFKWKVVSLCDFAYVVEVYDSIIDRLFVKFLALFCDHGQVEHDRVNL